MSKSSHKKFTDKLETMYKTNKSGLQNTNPFLILSIRRIDVW